jgi:hypothetical protein
VVLMPMVIALSFAGAGQALPPPPPPSPAAARVDAGQVRDPGRRLPPEPKGTAVIRGRVVAADSGTPIRRATVSLNPVPPATPPTTNTAAPVPANANNQTQTVMVNGVSASVSLQAGMRQKTATTDAQGAFEFRELPAGSYRLSAAPSQYSAAYLPTAYGAKKPNGPGSNDPGTPIDVADGQVFDKASIGLMRGAVISGRVTDESGEPLARVQLSTILFAPGSSRGIRTGGGNAQTDDLGQFRLFGLVPGEYAVAAEARGNTFVNPNAPPETEEDKIGFMTTFYPGTADDAAAQRVRARAGAETPGVEIRMVTGRLFHISGMVADSQGRTGRANGTLFKRQPGMTTPTGTFGFSTDEQGRFQMRNIPPGTYRLTVRQQPPPGARTVDGPMGEQTEFASMSLSVANDMDDVLVTTAPGATITGTVVFDGGPPQLAPNQPSLPMRVSAQVGDPENMIGTPTPQPATVAPDLTFTMKGLSGELLLRGSAPNNSLKAVLVGAEDITDTPHEFKNGERVTLMFTSRASTLEGSVTDGVGKPTSDAIIILFSDDKASWRTNSIRTRRGSPDPSGHYRLTGLVAGRYYLVALSRDRFTTFGPMTDASIFEGLSKEGTTVVIGEDESRQADVKVSAGGGL